MNILVTGATGFIGSHIADRFLQLNHNVRCTIRKTSNLRWLEGKPFELVEASLSDINSLKSALKDIDIVIHSAGLTAAKNYDEYLKGNRDGTRNLLIAAKEICPNLKRFVYISSQTAAGPATSLEAPIDENSECKPITSYGKSKYEAELEVLKFKDIFPITIIRPPAVYGPRDTATFDIFKVIRKGFCPLIGLKPKYVSLIHSSDLVDGIILATFSDVAIGQTYFISSDEYYDWVTINSIIANAMNVKKCITIKIPHFLVLTVAAISGFLGAFSKKPPVFNYEKGIDFIQNYWICSIAKAKRELNFQPRIPIKQGLTETAQWYIENNWL